MNKRGISGVLVTVLLILISIIAVVIVWVAVRNVIKEGTEDVDIGTFTLDLEILESKYDFSKATNKYAIKIKRNPGEGNFDKIIISIGNGTDSKTHTTSSSLDELEEETYDFDIAISNPTKVEIRPVVIQGDKEKIGSIGDSSSILCMSDCTDVNCGDNGCGGSCGECTAPETCLTNRTCSE